ncbi:MAG: hypothetical protein GY854_23415 [Deltaproteobacteria bacterium]|nr:hypothetical protein [Deltaproteobacteria bacterium]
MKRTVDDEKLTAYVLGELDDAEKKDVEDAVNGDESLKQALEELKKTAELSTEALGAGDDPSHRLTDAQRKEVRTQARGSGAAARQSSDDGLFSLGNLGSLATSTESPEIGIEIVDDELSGLVDIRSFGGGDQPDEESGINELISIQGSGFTPVLSPTEQKYGFNKKVIGIASAAAAFVIILVVVLVIALSGESDEDIARDATIAALHKQIVDMQKGGAEVDPDAMEALKNQLATAQAEKSKEEVGEDPETAPDEKPVVERKKRASSSTGVKDKNQKASAKSPLSPFEKSSSSAEPAPKKGNSELDALLGGSAKPSKKKSSPKKAKSSPGSSGGVKKSLDRGDVQKGMGSVASRVKRCGQGKSGSVTLKVVISPSGKVVSASPSGSFSGTPVGNCAARAVKSARFPRSQNSLTVRYPFKL